jgi:ATP-dependent DNA helicase RecQ
MENIMAIPKQEKQIRDLLRRVYGIASLRDGQRQVIDSVLSGRDTLAVMPTGSGKSLCYQVPAALLDGVTVVVSPLISLMKDQLDKLEDAGIDSAAQVNSSLTRSEQQAALEGVASSAKDLIFCTPERLATPDFIALLKQSAIALVVIDEAHCISQWGHDFRPAYLEIGAALQALGRPPLLALTATATEEVIADIAQQLGSPRIAVINTGIYRPNLHYRVRQVTNAGEKVDAALQLVRETEGVGIVYAATVKAVDELHALLQEAGESVTRYHGKLTAAERRDNQNLFMSGERRVMVATNAFGMGIDKSGTRFVIHLQVPANLEAYYQESGRAGRDGLDAQCTLIYFQDDKRVQQFFLMKHYPDAADLKAVYAAAEKVAQQQPAFTEADLKPALETMPESRLKVALKMLKDGKLLKRNRKLAYLLDGAEPKAALFEELAQVYVTKQQRDREALEQMVAYAQSGYCRWKLLLEYFGDAPPEFERCCQCDNCLAPPAERLHLEPQSEPAAEIQLSPPPAASLQPAPAEREAELAVGSQVRVPRFDIGTVLSVAGDRITIEFPENSTKTFMAEFVEPV